MKWYWLVLLYRAPIVIATIFALATWWEETDENKHDHHKHIISDIIKLNSNGIITKAIADQDIGK